MPLSRGKINIPELFAQTTDEEWQKIASKARTEARKEESVPLEEFLGSNES
ncbi:hypothetical protein [Salinibacter ruber]|uniref:hypothetical protein n=1 Tax=Salinibacter ruber TaxID=146919 RepID=UPI002166C2A7|nr:hypothetical protein [Salinibacter ruber]MCS3611102.1 hypothetical protein [Salinibacter ruber]MCS4195702.1 hypothetical protein [Salinibacter ruber]